MLFSRYSISDLSCLIKKLLGRPSETKSKPIDRHPFRSTKNRKDCGLMMRYFSLVTLSKVWIYEYVPSDMSLKIIHLMRRNCVRPLKSALLIISNSWILPNLRMYKKIKTVTMCFQTTEKWPTVETSVQWTWVCLKVTRHVRLFCRVLKSKRMT